MLTVITQLKMGFTNHVDYVHCYFICIHSKIYLAEESISIINYVTALLHYKHNLQKQLDDEGIF